LDLTGEIVIPARQKARAFKGNNLGLRAGRFFPD
jgi:hypothetical protein